MTVRGAVPKLNLGTDDQYVRQETTSCSMATMKPARSRSGILLA